jgi:hypothetical protein
MIKCHGDASASLRHISPAANPGTSGSRRVFCTFRIQLE